MRQLACFPITCTFSARLCSRDRFRHDGTFRSKDAPRCSGRGQTAATIEKEVQRPTCLSFAPGAFYASTSTSSRSLRSPGDGLQTKVAMRSSRLAARLAYREAGVALCNVPAMEDDEDEGPAHDFPTYRSTLETPDHELREPHLMGLQGRGADLHDTGWTSLRVEGCDLGGANLRRAVLDSIWMSRFNLAHADLASTYSAVSYLQSRELASRDRGTQ